MIYTYWTMVAFALFVNIFLHILWGKDKLGDGGQTFNVVLSVFLFFLLTVIPAVKTNYNTTNLLEVREVYKSDDGILLIDTKHNSYKLSRTWQNDTIEKGDVYYLVKDYNYFDCNSDDHLYWYNTKKHMNKKINKLKK